MTRPPLLPFVALFAGSAIVLGLFVARGFVLREHARIMLAALALIWLVGWGWTLASAAELAGGWRRLGVAGVLLITVGTALAIFAPALALALWTHTPLH